LEIKQFSTLIKKKKKITMHIKTSHINEIDKNKLVIIRNNMRADSSFQGD
jgi:hypothetical protein